MEPPLNLLSISTAYRLESFYNQMNLWEISRGSNRLIWFDNGRGILYISSGLHFTIEQYSREGWVLLITDDSLNTFFRHYPIYFNSPLFDVHQQHVHWSPSKALMSQLNLFTDYFSKLTFTSGKMQLVQPYIDLILSNVAEEYRLANPLPLNDHRAILLRRFKELAGQHFKNRSVKTSWFADQLGVGARDLSGLCSSRIGKNARAYVDYLRIAYAKRQLLTSSDAIKEIAINLGYEDNQGHFSTYFKRHTGQTPQQVRAMMNL